MGHHEKNVCSLSRCASCKQISLLAVAGYTKQTVNALGLYLVTTENDMSTERGHVILMSSVASVHLAVLVDWSCMYLKHALNTYDSSTKRLLNMYMICSNCLEHARAVVQPLSAMHP